MPRLLREVILGRQPTTASPGAEGDLFDRRNLGPDAWKNLPAEKCFQLGIASVVLYLQ